MHNSMTARIEEGQNDLISQLPESVLVEILSYLPTVDAVKMTLFPRFRNLLTYIRCLSFDECAFHDHSRFGAPKYDERFLNLIRHMLIRHERTTIDEFHLRFTFNFYFVFHDEPLNFGYASKEIQIASELTSWIDFSLRKQVKVLDINLVGCGFSKPGRVSYELPNSVLTNNCLMELSLGGFGINGKGCIQLMSLTKLSLREIKLSDEIMDKIFQGCPVLEELFLNECTGLHKLKLTHHNVKSLKIYLGAKNQVENSRVEISCPNVKSFELAGSIEYAHLNVSCSCSDAALYFSPYYRWERERYEKVMALFRKLAEANVFIPCAWTVLVCTIWVLLGEQIPSSGSKSVEFRLLLTKWHLPGICSILKSSKRLETLTFYVYPGSHIKFSEFNSTIAKELEGYDIDGTNYLKSQNDSFPCLVDHLKTVNIYGYVTKPYVFELVEFVLKNALVLERLVISTKRTLQPIHQYGHIKRWVENEKDHFTSKELHEFSQKLLSLPKASQSAVIQFCC